MAQDRELESSLSMADLSGGSSVIPPGPSTIGPASMGEMEVSILRPSGATAKVAVYPDDHLISLYGKVAEMFDTPLPAVKLLMDDGAVFPPEAAHKSVGSLGISNGTSLTFVSLPLLEVKLGAKIRVHGAGTDGFNGIYVAKINGDRLCFKKVCGAHVIKW